MASSHLPPGEEDLLRRLHEADMPALRARTRQLRNAGWTLAAIGLPLGAPRSTVRSWEHHPDSYKPNPAVANLPLPSPPGIRPAPFFSPQTTSQQPAPAHSPHTRLRVRALALDVPEADQRRIAQLAPLARRVRGGTPRNSPYREAKDELNALLAQYADRNVPIQRLAELAGVTYRAMKVRLDDYSTPAAV